MNYPWLQNPKPAPEDINYYVNFVLNAVLGRTAAADSLMRQYGPAIERVAASLRRSGPKPKGPLFRGILLEPPVPAQLTPDQQLTFISWSEQLSVACWFADPTSIMSGYALELKPKLQGFIITEPAPPAPVLFYYKWAKSFEIGGRRFDLSRLALIHPDMGADGHSQIEWALRTQFEVITANVHRPLRVQPKSAFNCPSTAELDRRLTWPGVFQ